MPPTLILAFRSHYRQKRGPRRIHGKADGAARAAVRLFERIRDLRLDVGAPPGKANTRAAPAASKKSTKKVAEATDASEQVAQVSDLYMERLWGSGRRSEVHPSFPLCAQVVIAPAFLGVGEDLVGLVDLFEVRIALLSGRAPYA